MEYVLFQVQMINSQHKLIVNTHEVIIPLPSTAPGFKQLARSMVRGYIEKCYGEMSLGYTVFLIDNRLWNDNRGYFYIHESINTVTRSQSSGKK